MRKFINKSFIFLSPFILVICLIEISYSINEGDLLRMGFLLDFNGYKRTNIFNSEFDRKKHFTNLSEINLDENNTFKIFVIGDSFSGEKNYHYHNYLAQNINNSVLRYDMRIAKLESPIQLLTSLLNGNIFDSIEVDYIILETIERNFIYSLINLDKEKLITKDSIKALIKLKKIKNVNTRTHDRLFLGKVKKVIKNKYNYQFDDNAYDSQTYKVATTKKLFTFNKNELLFYNGDLNRVGINNDIELINQLNNELNILSNRLADKKIKLIVMCPPDKFDFYYDFITDKSKYPKPLFFSYFDNIENRDYVYLDTKAILSNNIEYLKDIYFYDDTHWSPWAHQIIAKELESIVNLN